MLVCQPAGLVAGSIIKYRDVQFSPDLTIQARHEKNRDKGENQINISVLSNTGDGEERDMSGLMRPAWQKVNAKCMLACPV